MEFCPIDLEELSEGIGEGTMRCSPRGWEVSGGLLICTPPNWPYRKAGREDGGHAGNGGIGSEVTSATPSPLADIHDDGNSPNPKFGSSAATQSGAWVFASGVVWGIIPRAEIAVAVDIADKGGEGSMRSKVAAA